jgi:hypothetical protein
MYAQQNKRNVTYIDDLPELEDLESHPGMNGGPSSMMGVGGHVPFQQQGPPGGIPAKFQKFIRQPMGSPHPGSGMAPYNPPPQQEFFQPQQQPQQEAHTRPPVGSPTCLEIHDHVQQCPICSKFFNNDNTVYIIAIVILSIICILLLKRVLNL